MYQRTSGGTARRPSSQPRTEILLDEPDDEFLAAVLIHMWALASGRTLRRDVPPDQLSDEELIDFWADDMTPPSGRHARSGGPGLVADTQATRPTPQSRGKVRRRPSSARAARSRQERPADPAAA